MKKIDRIIIIWLTDLTNVVFQTIVSSEVQVMKLLVGPNLEPAVYVMIQNHGIVYIQSILFLEIIPMIVWIEKQHRK